MPEQTALTDTFDTSLVLVVPENPPLRADRSLLAVLPGFNVRVKDEQYKERVEDVAASIENNGFYDHKPFAVVMLPDDPILYVYDGEHRLDAVDLATLNGAEFPNGLPVAFPKQGVTVEDLFTALVHGNNGEKLAPVELAAVVERFLGLGKSKAEIADIIGRSGRHVDNLLVLAEQDDTVKEQVASGQIAAAEAVKIARKTGDKTETAKAVTAAVDAAKASGKKKATPKTMKTGPKMKTVSEDFDYKAGGTANDLLRLIAAKFREHADIGDKDTLLSGGSLTVRMVVVDKEAEAAKAARETAAAERAAAKAAREKEKVDRADAKAKADKEKADAKAAKEAEKAAKKAAAEKLKADSVKAAAKAGAGKAAAVTKAAAAGSKGPSKTAPKKPTQAEQQAAVKRAEAKAAQSKGKAATDDGNNGL